MTKKPLKGTITPDTTLDELPASIAAMITPEDQSAPTGLLEKVRDLSTKAWDLRAEKKDIEQKLTDTNIAISKIEENELPAAMQEAGMPTFELEKRGNHPAVKVKLQDNYTANIAAGWDEPKREAAFDWLQDNGHESLIKTKIVLSFEREDRAKALKLFKKLEKEGYMPDMEQSVHSSTLGSWLRTQVEKVKKMPPLDVIGGRVWKSAKLTAVKEKE